MPYSADGWAAFFATFPLYSSLYGGVAVVDQRALVESAAGTDNVTDVIPFGRSFAEMLPRLLFPRVILAGAINKTALAQLQNQFLPQLNVNLSYASPYVDANALLGDFTLQQLLQNPALFAANGAAFQSVNSPGESFPAFPVLETCSGLVVQQAFFAAAGPDIDRCVAAPVPITSLGSNITMFDAYMPFLVATNFSSPLTSINPILSSDRRLMLWNVPTGCYRFRLVYAPSGSGSLADRVINDPLSNAKAVMLNSGRPFRYLSPVISISVDALPSMTVPLDTPLPLQPSVMLAVRPNAVGVPRPFTDNCSGVFADPQYINIGLKLQRCPDAPESGVKVTVTAISQSSGLEYSLYVSGHTYDCARCAAAPAPGGQFTYAALFESVRFPSNPSTPPGTLPTATNYEPLFSGLIRAAPAGQRMPAGTYRLRFSSYATSALSSYTITLVDSPNVLLPLVNQTNGTAASALAYSLPIPVVVGQALARIPVTVAVRPVQTSASVFTTLKQTSPGASSPASPGAAEPSIVAMPNILVTARLVGGPPNAHAQLADSGSVAVSGADGVAWFNQLVLTAGASGTYLLIFSASTIVCNASSHSVTLSVTNPISAISFLVGGVSALSVSSAAAPSRLTMARAAPKLTVCLIGGGSEVPALNSTVSLFTVQDDGGSSSLNSSQAPPSCAPPQRDTRTVVNAGPSFSSGSVDSNGCLSIRGLTFAGLTSSTPLQVIFLVDGVESPPWHVLLQTPADANPVSLADLQAGIPIPLAMALAPLAVNTVYGSRVWRVLVGVGALISIVLFWALGGEQFIADLITLSGYYDSSSTEYVVVQTVTFSVALGLMSLALSGAMAVFVVFASLQLPCASRRRSTAAADWVNPRGGGRGGAALGVLCAAAPAPCRLARDPHAAVGRAPVVAAGDEHACLRRFNFNARRSDDSLFYAFSLRPRRVTSLVDPRSGGLSAAAVGALSSVFARYVDRECSTAHAQPAEAWRLAVARPPAAARESPSHLQAGTLGVWAATLAAEVASGTLGRDPTRLLLEQRLSRTSLLQLRLFLASVHLGSPRELAAEVARLIGSETTPRLGTDAFASLITPLKPTFVVWAAVVAIRERELGAAAVRTDLLRIAAAAELPLDRGETIASLVSRCYDALPATLPAGGGGGGAHGERWPQTGDRAPFLLSLFAPCLARHWGTTLEPPVGGAGLSIVDWCAMYHDRLAEPDVAAGWGTSRHPTLVDDSSVWAELRAWGFTTALSAPVATRGRETTELTADAPAAGAALLCLSPAAAEALGSIFAVFSARSMPRSSPACPTTLRTALTLPELCAWRATLGLPAVQLTTLQSAIAMVRNAEPSSEQPAPPPLGVPARSPVAVLSAYFSRRGGAGSNPAAGTDCSVVLNPLNDSTVLVTPAVYAAIASALYADPAAHIADVLAVHGFSRALEWRDPAAAARSAGDFWRDALFPPPRLTEDARAARASCASCDAALLQAVDARTVAPLAGASTGRWRQCLGRRPQRSRPGGDKALFLPQRLILSFLVSLVLCLFMGMLLMALCAYYAPLLSDASVRGCGVGAETGITVEVRFSRYLHHCPAPPL